MKRIKYLLLLILLLGIDQGTKYWARAAFMDGDSKSIIPKVLRLVYHENDGAAWGMFSGKAIFLIGLSILMTIFLIYCFIKMPMTTYYTPLRVLSVVVAAGAIGNNLIDRIIHGFVIDFIYFELIDFPVFNVADMYIVCGMIAFVAFVLFKYKDNDFDFLKLKKDK
ncbi:MAG: signal peptidase II [Clostridiales bacterium]|nr:signal peptidase II [Clostridiales bacterium]